MGPIGIQEMLAIFVLALLLFGPKKLPELGRILGKAFSEFRRVKSELKSTFDTHMRELEREARIEEMRSKEPKLAAPEMTALPSNPPSYSYSYPYDESPYGSTSYPHEESVAPPPSIAAPTNGTVARSNGAAPVGRAPVPTPESPADPPLRS